MPNGPGFSDQAGFPFSGFDYGPSDRLSPLLPAPSAAAPATPRSPAGADGHRSRLRARLLTAGPEAVADHELLEMLLFLALPRRDTKPIARLLIGRFGSFANAIAAPVSDLLRIEGLGEAGAASLKIAQASALRLARAELRDRPVLSDWTILSNYLHVTLARETVEQLRVLFLDNRNHLLADEAQARGTVNHAPVYAREVIKRALELGATALILVHNHPSGDPNPSRADIDVTQDVVRAAGALNIGVHDHIIIGNGRFLSFRQQSLM